MPMQQSSATVSSNTRGSRRNRSSETYQPGKFLRHVRDKLNSAVKQWRVDGGSMAVLLVVGSTSHSTPRGCAAPRVRVSSSQSVGAESRGLFEARRTPHLRGKEVAARKWNVHAIAACGMESTYAAADTASIAA
jgi:hypothetical protein